MGGLEVIKYICEKYGKQLDKKFIIVVMIVGVMEDDCDICLKIGMDDYISKLVKMEFLQRVLVYWGIKIWVKKNFG